MVFKQTWSELLHLPQLAGWEIFKYQVSYWRITNGVTMRWKKSLKIKYL